MKFALTGATGFVGQYLIDQLIDQGHSVRAWCRCSPNEDSLDRRVEWVQGNLRDEDSAFRLVDGSDVVIHGAVDREGESFLDEPKDPVQFFQSNVIGSMCLLQASAKVKTSRFIFISSGAVHDRIVDGRPLDETHPLWPNSLYGSYKASTETLVHHFGGSGKLNACSLRPTVIYGVANPIENSKWFSLIQKVKHGENVDVGGGSKCVHVSDVAKSAILLSTTDHPVAGETFNCCDRMISNDEVAEIACRLSGSDSVRAGIRKTAKHQIVTEKIQDLGMSFGGSRLLESTVSQLLNAC